MKRKLENVLGVLLAVAGAAFLTGLFFLQATETARRSLVDTDTYCPKQEGITVWGFHRIEPPAFPGETAIVIDATDSLNDKARNSLQKYFGGEGFLSLLDDFKRIRVYALKEFAGALAQPNFDMCVPPNKDVSPWLDNPAKRREEFENKFLDVFKGIIDELAQREEANRSPIFETLQLVSKDNQRVVMVSDMMEHSERCSLYRNEGRHDYNSFIQAGCAKPSDNLAGTEIDILFVSREKLKQLQNPKLIKFWEEHARRNYAPFRIRPLETIHISCGKADNFSECQSCLTDKWVDNYHYCLNLVSAF